jgi:diguanylate cyclase (GGDEF)-like protein
MQADLCWPANGILLAILISSARTSWTSLLAASFVASLAANLIFYPFWHSLSFSIANIAEVLFAGALLMAGNDVSFDLSRPKDFLKFILFAVILAPMVSVSITEGMQLLQGSSFDLRTIKLIYGANTLGIAVMVPLILAIKKREFIDLFEREKLVETIALFSGIFALSIVVFGQRKVLLEYLLFPALLFALFRLQRSGAAIAIFLMAIPAIYFTSHGDRFFIAKSQSIAAGSLPLQLFLATSLLTVHVISAVIAERDRLNQEMQVAYREALGSASLDHLTGLANRGTFDKELMREWSRASRENDSLSLLMIDVDHFKKYNDHYGHVAGDECLKSVASHLLRSMVRSSDLVARYGGEEFAVILPGSRAESAIIVANRIRDSLVKAGLPHAASKTNTVTLSIGVATFSAKKNSDPISLVQAADKALYWAKQNGRNQVARIAFEEMSNETIIEA